MLITFLIQTIFLHIKNMFQESKNGLNVDRTQDTDNK
jgi:hypothetical protein